MINNFLYKIVVTEFVFELKKYHLLVVARQLVWRDCLLDLRSVFYTVKAIQAQHEAGTGHLTANMYNTFFHMKHKKHEEIYNFYNSNSQGVDSIQFNSHSFNWECLSYRVNVALN